MRLTISTKLQGGFAVVSLLTLVSGGISYLDLNKLHAISKDLSDTWVVGTSYSGEMGRDVSEIERLALRHVLSRSEEGRSQIEQELLSTQQDFDKQLEKYQATIRSQTERDLYDKVKQSYQSLWQAASHVLVASKGHETAKAEALLNDQLIPAFTQARSDADALIKHHVEGGADAGKRGEEEFRRSLMATTGAILMVIVVGSIFGQFIARQIVRNVTQVAHAAEGIARGDLNQQLAVTTDDELGDMAKSFEEMVRNLSSVVQQVRSAASTVASGADEIGARSEDLSNSTKAQASASEQTASAMEEMAASIQHVSTNAQALAGNVENTSGAIAQMAASIRQVASNSTTLSRSVTETATSINEMAASIQQVAGNVEEATRVSGQASEAATGGRQAVEHTIDGMDRINGAMREVVTSIETLGKSSAEIGSIVEVIDDIAEQTNLLALNAAIEAARAGDAGRGFAVVADEVRKLAERSAKATGEIGKLIRGIQQETNQAVTSTQQGESAIQEGTRLAQTAGDALGAIVSSVDQASRLMEQIAHATKEQRRAADLISEEVEMMSALTEQVTEATQEMDRGSEQIILAAESMNQMTQQVSNATMEQRKGTEQTVQAVENIHHAAQEAASSTQLIAQSASDLQTQAAALQQAIAFFKDDSRQAASLPDGKREVLVKVQPLLPAGKA